MKYTTFRLDKPTLDRIAEYIWKAFAARRGQLGTPLVLSPMMGLNMPSDLITLHEGVPQIIYGFERLYITAVLIEPFPQAYGVYVPLIIQGYIPAYDPERKPIPVIGRMRMRMHVTDYEATNLYLREV